MLDDSARRQCPLEAPTPAPGLPADAKFQLVKAITAGLCANTSLTNIRLGDDGGSVAFIEPDYVVKYAEALLAALREKGADHA